MGSVRRCVSHACGGGAVVPHGVRPGDAEVPPVILINLLPHREERRKRRRAAFFVSLGVAAAIGAGIVVAIYLLPHLPAQPSSNGETNTSAARSAARIPDQGHRQPQARRDRGAEGAPARSGRFADRSQHTGAAAERSGQNLTPEGVFLTSIRQSDKVVTVGGMAQTMERVSELLRNLSATQSGWSALSWSKARWRR